ncbi:GapS4a family protein, partial [Flavobacterium frigidimaris]
TTICVDPKSVGEKGEKIVDYFFRDILGYGNVLHGESITCNKPFKHKDKKAKGNRTTHGIDAFVSMVSPMEDNVLDVGVISSKFTSKAYPNSPKTTFKEHFNDLAHTLECFKNSKLSAETNFGSSNVNKTEVFGILVWASNKSDENKNIISEVSNIQFDSDLVFDKIIVLDNNRLNFFVETIQNAKKEFGKENLKFVYHNTGLNNISLQSQSFGDFLPLEYLFSDIIPVRIEREGKVELLIFSKDEFSSDNCSKLLDFAKGFDHLGSISSIILSFPDFNDLEHSPIVQKELLRFGNYKYNKNLFLKKHTEDFRNY